MAEKFCKYFVFSDEEDGGVLPRGLALLKLHLHDAFYAEDPESGQLLMLDHLGRERLISIRLDMDDVRFHIRRAIEEAVHPLLIVDMGVPVRLQGDILDKIASSTHLRNWSEMARVPPIRVNIGVGTEVEDYVPGADAGERPRLIDSLYGRVTAKIDESGATVRCAMCLEFTEGTDLLSMPCGHAFHEGCLIEQVLRSCSSSCPLYAGEKILGWSGTSMSA